jgi:hypothetical protein
LNARCRGVKRDGDGCTLPANGSDGFCWAHSPKHAEERRRMASRAGKSRGSREVANLKAQLKDLIGKVQDGTLEPTRGNTMLRGYGVLIELIKLERGIFVEEDLARRIEELKRGEHEEVS